MRYFLAKKFLRWIMVGMLFPLLIIISGCEGSTPLLLSKEDLETLKETDNEAVITQVVTSSVSTSNNTVCQVVITNCINGECETYISNDCEDIEYEYPQN